jgi:hypothetical protein
VATSAPGQRSSRTIRCASQQECSQSWILYSCPACALFTIRCPTPDGTVPPEQESSQSGILCSRPARTLFIVRCTHGQKATKAYQMKLQRLLGPLGLKKGSLGAWSSTPNILQRRDFANTHLVHCDIYLSTSLSCNSVVLFHVLSLVLCVCYCCNSRSCMRLYSSLTLVFI